MTRVLASLSAALLLSLSAAAVHGDAPPSQGDATAADAPQAEAGKPWCAPEYEALPGDNCYYGEDRSTEAADKPRGLVIFLHGWVQKGAGWQHNQQRAIVRGAKRLGFSTLMPRGITGGSKRGGENTVSWPTGMEAQAKYEDAMLAGWAEARALIEKRQGAAFDEVYVVGFSNGAYYGSSLALRGRLDVDGYALFAGGAGYQASAPKAKRMPVFVGICNRDSTAKRARDLAKLLRRAGWPHRSESRNAGHTMADAHLNNAIAYLRKQARAGEPRQ